MRLVATVKTAHTARRSWKMRAPVTEALMTGAVLLLVSCSGGSSQVRPPAPSSFVTPSTSGSSAPPASPVSGPTPSEAASSPQPLPAKGALSPGYYVATNVQPEVAFTLAQPGWSWNWRSTGEASLVHGSTGIGVYDITRLPDLHKLGECSPLGPSSFGCPRLNQACTKVPADPETWYEHSPQLKVLKTTPVTVDGYPGTEIDVLQRGKVALINCDTALIGGEKARLIVLPVGSHTLLLEGDANRKGYAKSIRPADQALSSLRILGPKP